jgi:hypothetical protein
MKTRFYPGGAVMKGKVNREKEYDGLGVLSWRDGSSYVGFWKHDKRNGFGIYRSPEGIEYAGMWREGIRHGFGSLRHPNGEEYVGEWEVSYTVCVLTSSAELQYICKHVPISI